MGYDLLKQKHIFQNMTFGGVLKSGKHGGFRKEYRHSLLEGSVQADSATALWHRGKKYKSLVCIISRCNHTQASYSQNMTLVLPSKFGTRKFLALEKFGQIYHQIFEKVGPKDSL